VLNQGQLATGRGRLTLKGGKGRAVGSTGTALDTLFQLFFYTLKSISNYLIRHR